MIEIDAKKATVESVEDIETVIIDALASKVDGSDLMVFEAIDETVIPLLQEALSNTKQLFLDTTILPVVRIKQPAMTKLVLALVSLALVNALDALDEVTGGREDWKKVLFDRAKLTIANSSPELVMDIITKEFSDLIADFLVKI